MKNTLLSLMTRRTALVIIINDIQGGLDPLGEEELEGYKTKLDSVKRSIALMKPSTDQLLKDFNSPPASEQVLENRLIKQGDKK